MKKLLELIFVLAILFGTPNINRDVYYLYENEYPLVIEFEKLREAEEISFLPVTVFEECPGGVCPVR